MNRVKFRLVVILFVLAVTQSCDFNQNKKDVSLPVVKSYSYDSLKIPEFFNTLISNHFTDFLSLYQENLESLANDFNVSVLDSSNLKTILTLDILHELFTSQSASNGSRGKILNIPYFWHWTIPNPRYKIKLINGSELLSDVKPPNEFKKYNSYADIDRTPFLFLSDMANASPKYYSDCCDTFYTFGWCSEREMAFVSLCTVLGFNGKVVSEGNHSWSEFLVNLNLEDNNQQYFIAKVDNTFNQITWSEIKEDYIVKWQNYLGASELSNWYNSKAKSVSETEKIRDTYFSKVAMNHIETSVVRFLGKQR